MQLSQTARLMLAGVLLAPALPHWPPQRAAAQRPRPARLDVLATVSDGKQDASAALQQAVDAGTGQIRLPPGTYRITRPIQIDLDRVGPVSFSSDGTARIVMAGPGPALRFVGTHEGTAAPSTVEPNVWQRQRTPTVEGIEIVGDHPQACGVEASGTMQLTLTRLVVRDALHAVHLVRRNRNVILSQCHLYHNRGIGVFLDQLNLHQINIVNCHISYNAGGGIVARQSQIRNLQVGSCDIEANMGGPDSAPTANILLDSTGSSVGEVAIVGCTIQHSHDAPDSANIRILGGSDIRPFTDERRHGNITISANVLSDVQVNIELRQTRGVAITGNTIWKGYRSNLVVRQSDHVVLADNVFDRNPRYHYGDGATARLGLVFADCNGCTISSNHIGGLGDAPAAMRLRNCRRMNITQCTVLDFRTAGLALENVSQSRVSDCLIQPAADAGAAVSLRITGGSDNMVVDNWLGTAPALPPQGCYSEGNYVQRRAPPP